MKRYKLFFCLIVGFFSLVLISSVTADSITVLSSSSPFHVSSGSARIYGSSDNNHIIIEPGTNTRIIHFPGNNHIQINADSHLFTIACSGTVVTFQDSEGTVLKIPASTSSQMIEFNDSSQDLVITNNKVMLGGQVVASSDAEASDESDLSKIPIIYSDTPTQGQEVTITLSTEENLGTISWDVTSQL
jgi:hypothetical protein